MAVIMSEIQPSQAKGMSHSGLGAYCLAKFRLSHAKTGADRKEAVMANGIIFPMALLNPMALLKNCINTKDKIHAPKSQYRNFVPS